VVPSWQRVQVWRGGIIAGDMPPSSSSSRRHAGYAAVATDELEDSEPRAAEASALYSVPPPPPGWEELDRLPQRDAEEEEEEDEDEEDLQQQQHQHQHQQQHQQHQRQQHQQRRAEERAGRAQILTAAPRQYHIHELEEMSLGSLRQLAQDSGIGDDFDSLLAAARPDRPKRKVAVKLAEANSRLPTNWHRVRWLPTGTIYYWDTESNTVQLNHPAAQYRRRTGFQMLTAGPSSAAAGSGPKGTGRSEEAEPLTLPAGRAEMALSVVCTLGCGFFGLWLLYSSMAWMFG
jgi:hypothetical protein